MLNKHIRFIVFFLYSWCIYQSYFFITAPLSIYNSYIEEGYLYLPSLWNIILSFFWIHLLILVIQDFALFIQNVIIPFIIPVSMLIGLYTFIFNIWWKRQTILSAWLLALTGMFVGPGIFFCIRMPGDGSNYTGLYAIIGINIFYFLLFIGNFLQKKYWPSNKLCNRIRSILTWPCLRT